jgi:hypothetical protein
MKLLRLALLGLLPAATVVADETWDYSVQVSAKNRFSPPAIVLVWPQDAETIPNRYTVYRKLAGTSFWDPGTVLSGRATGFTDTRVTVGKAYEYQVVKDTPTHLGYGYIQTGIHVPLVENRGKLVLIVDRTYASSLASELSRLQSDLVGDGWTVLRHDVSRSASPASVKQLILSDYNAAPSAVKAVFLFGHVPVPYSGLLNPDGHDEHLGAWPADVYYGDMRGKWTDFSVNYRQNLNSDPVDAKRLTNVPGDGKFDQTTIPSSIQLQVGRVDLANMPGLAAWNSNPSFPSEVELLRQYLKKDHNFRHKLFTLPRRAIVADFFGAYAGEAFAANAYRNFAPFFSAGGITNLNLEPNEGSGAWLPTLQVQGYLWAYGAGAGSYDSIAGLGAGGSYQEGTTTDFVGDNIHAAFVLLFGSWLGDWDHKDAILRSVLATPTYGLASVWAGRPHWFVHPMGMGETIGYCTRLTQNNTTGYKNQVNRYARGIHIALMGDPTLRMHPVAPPRSLSGLRTPSRVTLKWNPSLDAVWGYHVYRSTSINGPFNRLTHPFVTRTTFVDLHPLRFGVYMVRAVKLENTASGSYYNLSQGVFWK